MESTFYIGTKLEWEYVHRTIVLLMPDYLRKYLHIFQHILRGGNEYPPHIYVSIKYWQKVQYADPLDVAEYFSEKETNLVQQVCGTLLYYAITTDNTLLCDLSNIYSEQSKATKNRAKKVPKLLNYLASNPNAEIQYTACGMQLAIHYDISYLSVSQSRSRAGGVHFLSEGPYNFPNPKYFVPNVNGIILVVCDIMHNFMAS